MSEINGEKTQVDNTEKAQGEAPKTQPNVHHQPKSYVSGRNDMLDSPYSIYMSQGAANSLPYQGGGGFNQNSYGYSQPQMQYQQPYQGQPQYQQQNYNQQRRII